MKGGNSIANVVVGIIISVVLILGISLLIYVSIQKTTKPSHPYSSANTVVSKPESDPLNLSFPECFDISPDAKHVYTILKSGNNHKKYAKLLDAYSLALCQQRDFKKSCSMDSLNQRLATLDSWGANQYNKDAIDIVNSLTKVTNNKIGQFLVEVCDICEKQIRDISNDKDVLRGDKTQIIGFNSQFYRNHVDSINKSCS